MKRTHNWIWWTLGATIVLLGIHHLWRVAYYDDPAVRAKQAYAQFAIQYFADNNLQESERLAVEKGILIARLQHPSEIVAIQHAYSLDSRSAAILWVADHLQSPEFMAAMNSQ